MNETAVFREEEVQSPSTTIQSIRSGFQRANSRLTADDKKKERNIDSLFLLVL